MSSSFTIGIRRGQVHLDHLAKMYFCQKWLFKSAAQRRLAAIRVVNWRIHVVDAYDGEGPYAFEIIVEAAAYLEPDELARAEATVKDLLGKVREDAPFFLDVEEPDTNAIRAVRWKHNVYFFSYAAPSTRAGPGPRGKMIVITYFAGNADGRNALMEALLALGSRAATVAPRRSPQRVALAQTAGAGVGGTFPLNLPPLGPGTSTMNGFGLLDSDDSDDDSDNDGKTEEEDRESDDDEDFDAPFR